MTNRETYEAIMSQEDLREFRERAKSQTRLEEGRPCIEIILRNYMVLLERTYYERITLSTGVRE